MTPQKVNDLIAVGQGDQNKQQKNQREKKGREISQVYQNSIKHFQDTIPNDTIFLHSV